MIKVLNIYEFYYTFFSWHTYGIIYQIFWSTKLLLIPFLLLAFINIKNTFESDDPSKSIKKTTSSLIIGFLVFFLGVVPTVPLKVKDITVSFIGCDIQKEASSLAITNQYFSSDSVRIPIVPYFLFVLGSGINDSVGNNLSCMQSIAADITSIADTDFESADHPELTSLFDNYMNSCHSKMDHFTGQLINRIGPIKTSKIYNHYRGGWQKRIKSRDPSKSSVIKLFKKNLLSNNEFLMDIPYGDNPIQAINKIGNSADTRFIHKGANVAQDIFTLGYWQLNSDEELWVKNNLPIVMVLRKSEIDFLGGSPLGANALAKKYSSQTPSCDLSDVEVNSEDPKECYSCAAFADVILKEVAIEKARNAVHQQLRKSLESSGYSHLAIVRPSLAELYNQQVSNLRLKGDAEKQKKQLENVLKKIKGGFVYDGSVSIDANGALYPPNIDKTLAIQLLDKFPDEIGVLSGTATNPSILEGDRENFFKAQHGAIVLANTISTKGQNALDMLNKVMQLEIAKALMVQIIPMVLMLYILFWIPFMILGMYNPANLLKGSAVFFAVRLTPLFVMVISSTTHDISTILSYNVIDKRLIDIASSVVVIATPMILLAFLASSFGSNLSGAMVGMAGTAGAGFAAASGGSLFNSIKQAFDSSKKIKGKNQISSNSGTGSTGSRVEPNSTPKTNNK